MDSLVSTRQRRLTVDEIKSGFRDEAAAHFPPILSIQQLSDLLGISKKTIYEWVGKGRLEGAFRKRGKHILVWRDRALEVLFNGKEWTDARTP